MATLFSKILNGEIPGKIHYQDDLCAVLADIHPQAPTHLLIVPKKEIPSIGDATEKDAATLGHLLLTAAKIARENKLDSKGYRLVINYGEDAGMSVPHLHVHLLAGRKLTWPPG